MRPPQGRAVQPNSRFGAMPYTAGQGGSSDTSMIKHERRIEHIASVSRSSSAELPSLKECVMQEEFKTFIDKKLRTFWNLYGADSPTKPQTEAVQRQKKDSQENILILFRKLREGILASDRKDNFALEVYETSLYLSVVFDSPVQTTSILSRLVPHICSARPGLQPFPLTVLILLLHQLVVTFPSQKAYLEQIECLVPNLLGRPSAAYLWISALTRSLRTSNFVQFEKLSHPDAFEHLLPLSCAMPSLNVETSTVFRNLPRGAVLALVSRLRSRVRDAAWVVLRNAYRELSSSDKTQKWLGKRLFFDSIGSTATVLRFDEWVREKCQDGQLRPKEGVEGSWMVCRAR